MSTSTVQALAAKSPKTASSGVRTKTNHRKAYKPRLVAANPVAVALFGVAKPKKADVNKIHNVQKTAFNAMRQSAATIGHWAVLAGAVDVAKAIERHGVVRGLMGHLVEAEQALASIYSRANKPTGWQPGALYFYELDAISTFLHLHKYQLLQLSNAEYLQACQSAANKINGGGAKALVVEDLDQFSVEAA